MTILIAEDDRFTSHILKKRIETTLHRKAITTTTLDETLTVIRDDNASVSLALMATTLPDGNGIQATEAVLRAGIPVITITPEYNEQARKEAWSKGVVDYVVKEGAQNLDYIVSLIDQLDRNQDIDVLVVEDSLVYRTKVSALLTAHGFRVLEAENGEQAIQLMGEHPDIKLTILDYNMAGMDGFQIANKIRQKYSREEMSIIGMSAFGDANVAARFIKNGANDFIYKPFTEEEFYCRVTQNIQMMTYVDNLRDLTIKDPLTKIHNRRFFMETGDKLFAAAKRKNVVMSAAMMDIDFFKKVNDTYGHDVGDVVLKGVASTLTGQLRASDVVARMGGEEFAAITVGMDRDHAFNVFDRLRNAVSKLVFDGPENSFNVTISVGVCVDPLDSLDAMMKRADDLLYQAKEGGRNRVIIG